MIYIVRHGQTLWNLQGKKQGRRDSPLTAKGVKQASNVAKILKQENVRYEQFKKLASPLWRCRQFLSLICEEAEIEYNSFNFLDDLKEHSFGMWEGLTEEEIKIGFPEMYSNREKSKWNFIAPMGESYELVYKRVEKVLNCLEENDNVLFVCHEMISKALRGKLLNLSNEQIMKLKHPQDVVYKIEDGKLEELR